VQLKRRSLTARLLEVLRYFGPFGFLAFGCASLAVRLSSIPTLEAHHRPRPDHFDSGTAANILQLKQVRV
jgi:hypothetical protein